MQSLQVARSPWGAVQDSEGRWWSPDGLFRWDGYRWLANELSFSRIPLSGDSARLIRRGAAVPRAVLWFLAVALAALAAGATLARIYPLAIFFAVLAVGGGGGAYFSQSYVKRDLRDGALTRASGVIVVRDTERAGQYGSVRQCQLQLGRITLYVGDEAADAIREHASCLKLNSNLLLPRNDVLLFNGSVDFAPRTRVLVSVQTPDGQSLWRHRGPGLHVPKSLMPKNWRDAAGLAMELGAVVTVVVVDADNGPSLSLPVLIGLNAAGIALAWLGHWIRRSATREAL